MILLHHLQAPLPGEVTRYGDNWEPWRLEPDVLVGKPPELGAHRPGFLEGDLRALALFFGWGCHSLSFRVRINFDHRSRLREQLRVVDDVGGVYLVFRSRVGGLLGLHPDLLRDVVSSDVLAGVQNVTEWILRVLN